MKGAAEPISRQKQSSKNHHARHSVLESFSGRHGPLRRRSPIHFFNVLWKAGTRQHMCHSKKCYLVQPTSQPRHHALKSYRDFENRNNREMMRLLVERRRKLSADGETAWIPAPLANPQDPWVGEENGLLYKAAKGRAPAQALIVYFRT